MRRVVVFYADFGEDAIKTRYRECPVRGIFDRGGSQDSALRRKIERRVSSGRTAALCKVHGPQWVDCGRRQLAAEAVWKRVCRIGALGGRRPRNLVLRSAVFASGMGI